MYGNFTRERQPAPHPPGKKTNLCVQLSLNALFCWLFFNTQFFFMGSFFYTQFWVFFVLFLNTQFCFVGSFFKTQFCLWLFYNTQICFAGSFFFQYSCSSVLLVLFLILSSVLLELFFQYSVLFMFCWLFF